MGQNRCTGCNHFAELQQQPPQIEAYDFDADELTVEVDVRISLATVCCHVEVKEHTFPFCETPEFKTDGPLTRADIGGHKGRRHSINIEDLAAENTSRTQEGRVARFDKQFYGVRLSGRLKCSCGDEIMRRFDLTDEIEASAMHSVEQ
jgi:hypothetical protein